MGLMIHDQTGTQTDCEKPLSRKKLKQLMPRNPHLSSLSMNERFGRKTGFKLFSNIAKKRQERARKRKLFSKHSLPDGTTFQLMPTAAEVHEMRPTIFERLGGLFKNLQRKAERQSAKGK